MAAFIARFHQVEESEFSGHLYAHRGIDAIAHLFRVVTSLDSMVVGEPQVFGQVREAYGVARRAGCVREVEAIIEEALGNMVNLAPSLCGIGR